MSQFLQDLVESMSEYAQIEKDSYIEVVGIHDDRVEARLVMENESGVLDRDYEGNVDFVMVDRGEWEGHRMVQLLEEPTVVMNAVPAAVLAVLMEL